MAELPSWCKLRLSLMKGQIGQSRVIETSSLAGSYQRELVVHGLASPCLRQGRFRIMLWPTKEHIVAVVRRGDGLSWKDFEGANMAVVLLVEDNVGDVRLTQEVFKEANRAIQLHVARDGTEARSFLKHEGANVDAPRPNLILLDLNLPKIDGYEVLSQIKKDESLRTIPTIILTTSVAEADIVRSYQLHANSYLCKPVQLDDFEALLHGIADFWLKQVKLPQQSLAARG